MALSCACDPSRTEEAEKSPSPTPSTSAATSAGSIASTPPGVAVAKGAPTVLSNGDAAVIDLVDNQLVWSNVRAGYGQVRTFIRDLTTGTDTPIPPRRKTESRSVAALGPEGRVVYLDGFDCCGDGQGEPSPSGWRLSLGTLGSPRELVLDSGEDNLDPAAWLVGEWVAWLPYEVEFNQGDPFTYNWRSGRRQRMTESELSLLDQAGDVRYYLEGKPQHYDVWSTEMRVPSNTRQRITQNGNVDQLLPGAGGPCWTQFHNEIWCKAGDDSPHRVLRERLAGPVRRGEGFIAWETGDGELAVIATSQTDGGRVVLRPQGPEGVRGSGMVVADNRVIWAVTTETGSTTSTTLHIATVTPSG